MHLPINVKSPNNVNKWQMEFNSAFKGLIFFTSGKPTVFIVASTEPREYIDRHCHEIIAVVNGCGVTCSL
jgi:hypothetical protein